MKPFRLTALLLLLLIVLPSQAKPREKGWIALPDATLYYEAYGEGEPLIFVHGHSLDRRMWRKQVAYFKEHYRVIVYDARGYGRSSKQEEEVLFTHADDLVALMNGLQIERAHLVGLSMGGFIVGDMVAIYPERILTATMAEGVIRSTPSIHEPMTKAEIAQKQATEVLKTKRPTLPCLYIRAQRPNEATRNAPSMIRHTPNGEFVRIEDSGHMVNMEQPERFNEVIWEFLERAKSKEERAKRE